MFFAVEGELSTKVIKYETFCKAMLSSEVNLFNEKGWSPIGPSLQINQCVSNATILQAKLQPMQYNKV